MKDVAILIHETAGLIRRRFEQAGKPEGLTLMQWRVLGLLARSGPMRQVALKEALETSPMTISDVAERLEVAGLVARAVDPDDSRAKILALTEVGDEKVAAMRAISETVFAEAFAGLDTRDLEALRTGLGKIKENLGGGPCQPGRETTR